MLGKNLGQNFFLLPQEVFSDVSKCEVWVAESCQRFGKALTSLCRELSDMQPRRGTLLISPSGCYGEVFTRLTEAEQR